jgi:hypothetical protein
MNQLVERINSRQILYLKVSDDLSELMEADLEHWVLFVICDDPKLPILESFVETCINKGVLYMCAAGAAGSEMDDRFDMNLVMREIKGRPMPEWYTGEDDVLLTTWHEELEEGFWFATTVAVHDQFAIKTVLVVNLTGDNMLPTIKELTRKISREWLPPD